MEKFFTINSIAPLLLTLPEDDILSRLGRNRFLTVMDQSLSIKLRIAMQKAFALCQPRGRWKLLKVTADTKDTVELDMQKNTFLTFSAVSTASFTTWLSARLNQVG